MKLRLPLFLALLLPVAAFAEIQFNGVVIDSNGKTKVSLINTDTLDSHWVAINGKFGGYTVVAYKAGKPANPAKPGDTAVKDSVILSVNGRTQNLNLNDALLLASPATSFVSVTNAQPGQTNAADSLNAQLQQALAQPNPNPQLIQALQQAIQRQAQQPATATVANGGVTISSGTLTLTNNATGAAATTAVARRTMTTNPDGSRTTTTYDANGQVLSTSTQPANPAAP